VGLSDFSPARQLALLHKIVALPVTFDLVVPAALLSLLQLSAVTVDHERRTAVGSKRNGRIVTRDREGCRRLERELHRPAHPCTLLIAHAAPAPSPPPPPPSPATPPPPPPPPGAPPASRTAPPPPARPRSLTFPPFCSVQKH